MAQRQSSKHLPTILVVILYLAVLSWGIVQVLFPSSVALYYFFAFFLATSAACWAVFDARYRGKPIPHILQFITFLFWPIAVPIYLICTRGFRGLGLTIIHALGLLLTLCLGFYATVFSLFGLDAYAN